MTDTAAPGPIVAWTDGSCLGNPGAGGWCWWVSERCWAAGGSDRSTNNAMELTAVLELLKASRPAAGRPLHIKADSKYVIDACTRWIHGWKRNGWKTKDKKPVANRELMEALDAELAGRTVTFEWVRGHNGEAGNELVDTRAREQAAAAQSGQAGRVGTHA